MALTDKCDVFGSVDEKAFNNVVRNLQQQRPSLFNHGTISFVRDNRLLCNQTIIQTIDRDVGIFGNPIVTERPLLAILGYTGPFGLEYCFQLSEFSIDFHPSNVHSLPPELRPPLRPQCFSLKARVCAGLACPTLDILNMIAPDERPFFPVLFGPGSDIQQPKPANRDDDQKTKPIVVRSPTDRITFDPKNIICFCLDLYVVLEIARGGPPDDPFIAFRLANLEIVDVTPVRLENAVECYLKNVLIMGVLPKIKLALKAFVFSIKDFLTVQPTPISAAVPFNPAVEDDQIKVFITVIA
ncbi:MAG: hypothetical protein NTU53_06945 [Planctomycetota bacterium]|nr:hypothetical protein [Planctomycetota bacterium]